MYVCYYFLNLLQNDKVGNDTFLASLIFVSMLFAKDSKILIKLNTTVLVREFPSKGWNIGLVYKLLQKQRIAGSVGHRPGSGR